MKYRVFLLASLFVLSACGAPAKPNTAVTIPKASSGTAVAYSLPADPTHGALTHLAIGALAGADGTVANGSAAVWMFADNTSRLNIQLNIAANAKGTLYIAWFKDPVSGSIEKIGTVANTGSDVRHSLTIEAQKDYKRYSEVFVTRESSAGVSVPSKIVANGILKPTAR